MNAIATLTSKAKAVHRNALGASFNLARLPLSAAERATGQRGNEEWPPAVAFEGIEAHVETIVGSLLRDETLEDRGRLRQAKVAELRRAMALETVAEQERAQGRRSMRGRLTRADARRERAEQAAEHGADVVETAAESREREAKAKEQKKIAGAQRSRSQQEKSIERVERATRTKALREESAALEAQREALAAEQTVANLDDAIEAKKAARKTG